MPAPARARWVVLGASGQIGHFLIGRLREAGESTLALSRRAPEHGAQQGSVLWLRGDLDAGMPAIACEHVLSAGPLDACARWLAGPSAAECRSVVAFSSTSLESKAESPDAAERALAERLARAEAELSETCARRGMSLLLLRPTLIYGCGLDRNLTRLAHSARRLGFLPLPRSSGGLRQPVHADDLAALALSAEPVPGERSFALAGGETLAFRDMAGRVLACLPERPRLVTLPDVAFGALNGALRLFRPHAALTPAQVRRLGQDLVFDDAPARQELGWSPRPFLPEPGMFVPPARADG